MTPSMRMWPLFGILLVLLAAGRAAAGVVEDWNETFLQAVRKESPPPCLVTRNLAIFHLGMHRAVERARDTGLSESGELRAADEAGRTTFLALFPSQNGLARRAPSAPEDAAGAKSWAAGAAIGREEAERVIRERGDDGASTTVPYVPNPAPGRWRRTPPRFRPPEFPHWGRVRPFVVPSVASFLPAAPPRLGSPEFSRNLTEVRDLGGQSSRLRTVEQSLIARFWADFSYTDSPGGRWNHIARGLTRDRGLPLRDAARFFSLLNLALADTCIAVWHAKYHYDYWRPVSAVQDGHRPLKIEAALTWQSYLPSPPHPEYPSGHSAMSGAAAEILRGVFGEVFEFSVTSIDVPDAVRRYRSFRECAEEIARSRVFAGIHYDVSGTVGLELGRAVAEAVQAELRRAPTRNRSLR